MFSLIVPCRSQAERDIVIADLWEAGATGITEEAESVRAFFESDRDRLIEKFAHLQPTVIDEEPQDWVRFAKDQWTPFPVGDRFYLIPEWQDDPAPPGRLRLTIHPGMACGTGTHPATQLCLMAMEQHVRPGAGVLDVGTGAGILADAARLLGASRVIGCDIEHDSTVIARHNLDRSIGLFTGSVRSVRDKAFDWAVCNLNAVTIRTLAADLQRIAGGLILSGFLDDESPQVASLFSRKIQNEMDLEGYACLVF